MIKSKYKTTHCETRMLSFKEFLLNESTAPGNYVAIGAERPVFVDMITPRTGKESKDFHVTLMYSKESDVPPEDVLDALGHDLIGGIVATITSADVFDSQTNDSVGCVVLKLHSNPLRRHHNTLKSIGLKHSFDDFSPHVTLWYDVDKDEARELASVISSLLARMGQNTIYLHKIKSEHITEDWNKDD